MSTDERALAQAELEKQARRFLAMAETLRRRAAAVDRGELVLNDKRKAPSERRCWARSYRREAQYFIECADRIRSLDVEQFARNQRHRMRYVEEE